MEFGSDPSHYQEFGKQKLCPVGQIRCVENILLPENNLSTKKPNRNKFELPCKKAHECDIPFSPSKHILTYGYQKPCLQARHEGHFSQRYIVRCVTSKVESFGRAAISRSTKETLSSRIQKTSRSTQLPCKLVSECEVAFNPAVHIASFGFQIPCPEENVRCVSQTTPDIALPCVPSTECSVVFGTGFDHFLTYGSQESCLQDDSGLSYMVRCVETTPVSRSIGPKPIFVTISEIVGPQVINNYGKTSRTNQENVMKDSGKAEGSEKLGGKITTLANIWTPGANDSSNLQDLGELIKKYVQTKIEAK